MELAIVRRMLRRCFLMHVMLGLTAALLLPGSLRAAPAKRTVMVLSVAEEGRQQDSLRGEVSELVERAGATLADSSGLSATARRCDEPTCLEQLGQVHDVDLILAARIQRHSRHDRLVEMWIYDTRSGRDQSAREFCDARALRDCLTGLAGKLVGPQLAGTPPPEPSSPALRLTSPSVSAASLRSLDGKARLRLPTWRLALGSTLAALAVGGLITGIVASAKNSTPGDGCSGCNYRMSPLMASSFTAAGLSIAGTILSFALPVRTAPAKDVSK